jgi:lipid A 3-O-deacylase
MPIPIHGLSVSKMDDFMKAYSLGRRISSAVWYIMLCTFVTASWNAKAQQRLPFTNSISTTEVILAPEKGSIWENGVGGGFRSTTYSFGLSAGATYGFSSFGSVQSHDLALTTLSYGHMLSRVWGEGHWYRGNLEFRLELFTGAQFSPSREWFVGLTPHLRYNFATGTRWIPFVDGGAGVTATSIGPPDLSGTFEFNLQAGTGIQWFLKDNVALTMEARYVHWSCAGISNPNLGLNGVTGMLGLSFFF